MNDTHDEIRKDTRNTPSHVSPPPLPIDPAHTRQTSAAGYQLYEPQQPILQGPAPSANPLGPSQGIVFGAVLGCCAWAIAIMLAYWKS